MNEPATLPAVRDRDPDRELTGMIERVITEVPPPRTHREAVPADVAQRIAREAAQKAALVSGSLALPPGPLGMLTVLPDIYVIWKIQRQMVADVFAVYGRTAELTRTHMLYCLFRHAASQVLRDVAVRTGQRVVMQQLTAGALKGALSNAGAAAVASYAYWDTLQVARTAQRLLDETRDATERERA